MPKFGLKCFVGSFMLSLVAVFAVTKAYFVMSVAEHQQREALVDVENIPVKNIELFAANEENDPLYDKFNNLNRHNELPMVGDNTTIVSENHADVSDDSVIYEPESSENAFTTDTMTNSEFAYTDDSSSSDYIAQASFPAPQDTDTDAASEDLQIADASEASDFMIPLVHTYKTASGTVTYSDSADDNQIAMASRDVSIDNLGNDGVAAVTDPLPESSSYISKSEFSAGLSAPSMEANDAWSIAEISNRHVGRNSLAQYTAKHETEIVAPDQQAEVPAATEYKMQQNILIPIPESIKNEHNLTPQFSTSEENLRLERELRAKHQLPALENDNTVISDDDEQDFEEEFEDDEEDDEETSKSLTDSIAEWFSGGGKKAAKDNIVPKSNKSKSTKKKSDKKEESSIFNKLLGIGKSDKDSVSPSELKLSFQPNRAEISGQTLEWLHAFSDNSIKDENVFIEIRIDKTAPYALQEKRLKLLYKILANNGVDYHKINIIFTDREPNSFIIRNVRYSSEDDKIKAMKRADNPWY